MSTFEELSVWQKSTDLCVDIYRSMRRVDDRSFKDQVCRAALSISSNIAEGDERSSPRDTASFLRYAKGSAGELRSQIYSGERIGYLTLAERKRWSSELVSISRMLFALAGAIRDRAP